MAIGFFFFAGRSGVVSVGMSFSCCSNRFMRKNKKAARFERPLENLSVIAESLDDQLSIPLTRTSAHTHTHGHTETTAALVQSFRCGRIGLCSHGMFT